MGEGKNFPSLFHFNYTDMKKICLLLLLLVCGSPVVMAQDHTILLFEEFTIGKIHFKNHSVTSASMNYDAAHGRMLFMQDEQMMEVVNSYMIDSISLEGRQFIPQTDKYLEKIAVEHGAVYINWVLKDVNIGSKGAFGMPTQGKVETLNNYDLGVSTEAFTPYEKQKVKSTDMYRRKNANTYFIQLNGVLKEVKSTKQLIKLLPDKETEIRQYISENKPDMKELDEAVALLDFCLSLIP